ncbi:MAG: iron-containing alcohol dehydrogenase [Bacteroidales bacterium]
MNNFEFFNPTQIIFGKGSIKEVARIAKEKKIMITFGGGSVKTNGVYEQVTQALASHNYIEFWGIEPNPKYETLIKAIEIGKKEKIDFLLSVGGGSVLDGTKFIASAISYDGEPWDLIIDNRKAKNSIPLASVMTLPATGSEMNSGAVISRLSTDEKYPFFCQENFPKFSILDPETTYTLPKLQIACGVIDTFVHTVEQYITHTDESLLMDRWAEGILLTLKELSPKLYTEEKPQYETRSNFMLSATMALNGFISMGVSQDWATHMIGHELTALKGLTHAVTLAIIYPSLLRTMKHEKLGKLVQYAERVWNINSGTDLERAEAGIVATEKLFNNLGINTTLSGNGVDRSTIDTIVTRCRERNYILGENRSVTPDKVKEILELAY